MVNVAALSPGDCGAPLWFEGQDGTNTLVAVVEGYVGGKDDHSTVGSGINVYPNYLTVVAKSEILDFIEEVLEEGRLAEAGGGASQTGSQEGD